MNGDGTAGDHQDHRRGGHVAGAAFDVFSKGPATENPLFGLPNVVAKYFVAAIQPGAAEDETSRAGLRARVRRGFGAGWPHGQ